MRWQVSFHTVSLWLADALSIALQCLGIDAYPRCCEVLHPMELQIDAGQRALMQDTTKPLHGQPVSRLLYVGAFKQLYEHDGIVVLECPKDWAWAVRIEGEQVGMDVSVFVEVRGITHFPFAY